MKTSVTGLRHAHRRSLPNRSGILLVLLTCARILRSTIYGLTDAGKNADVYAELIHIQLLDDRSLALMRDAKDDGKKALQILKEHYMSQGKPNLQPLKKEEKKVQLIT